MGPSQKQTCTDQQTLALQMMAVAGSFMEKQLRPIFEKADIDYGTIKVSIAGNRGN